MLPKKKKKKEGTKSIEAFFKLIRKGGSEVCQENKKCSDMKACLWCVTNSVTLNNQKTRMLHMQWSYMHHMCYTAG